MSEIRVGGKYKIISKLGEGSFGEIFQGKNIKTGEDVAVKLVIYSLIIQEKNDVQFP